MVLLVDDQIIIGEVVRRIVREQANMEFHYCASARDAIATAKEVKPTVILQDLVMPGVNGLDLVRKYRADPVTAGIPIIVLSSKEDPITKKEAFRAGANDYLVKLPDEIELVARLQYHSKAYLNQLQRDDAYRALRESQRQLIDINFELQRLTNQDGLTGLNNRRYLDQHLEGEWKRAAQTETRLSLLMIDVDNFKSFNDINGHLAGDAILKQVAEIIQKHCRASVDCAARYGGEEFVIVLRERTPIELKTVAEALCSEIEAQHLLHPGGGASQYVTVSIGGASVVPRDDETFYFLIDAADRALYKAKHAGRNRVIVKERSEREWLVVP
jgi:two-component system, chemotaxis family, response regulator WspR